MAAPRVIIRRPTRRDAVAFVEAMRSSRSLHRPWVAPPRTTEAFDAYLRRGRCSDYDARLVCRRDTGAIVGVFNISNIIRGALNSAFLGYYAVAEHAGHGLMTEGMLLTLEHAYGELRLHRAEANIQPGNTASIALVRRCGFVREGFSQRYLKVGGRWRDHERWAHRRELAIGGSIKRKYRSGSSQARRS